MGTGELFSNFCINLVIDTDTRSSISSRYKLITKRLNNDYWDDESDTNFSRYVGSYGRGTAIKGISDLDMIFILPQSLYTQYNNHVGNGQSALLQSIKNSIQKTYSTTHIAADGQIVEVSFNDNISFQILPVFGDNDKGFIYPDTNNGGSWKLTKPIQEIETINNLDSKCNSNLKKLCKMMRARKSKWSVEMSGFLIDTLAYNFLLSWKYNNNSYGRYDWMIRDFLLYLSNQDSAKNYRLAPGSNQHVYRSGLFEAKAKKCYNIAIEAIKSMSDGYESTATQKRKEIFGSIFN